VYESECEPRVERAPTEDASARDVVSSARLEENLVAADVTLTSDDLREIDGAAAKIQIHGARLPEAVLAQTGR